MNNMNCKALWIKFEKFTTVIKLKKFERHNYGPWDHHPLVFDAHLTTIFHASLSCSFLFRVYNYFFVRPTPFLYIVQPFPSWSSSFCFSFHLPEHHLLYQSAIFHSTDVPK